LTELPDELPSLYNDNCSAAKYSKKDRSGELDVSIPDEWKNNVRIEKANDVGCGGNRRWKRPKDRKKRIRLFRPSVRMCPKG